MRYKMRLYEFENHKSYLTLKSFLAADDSGVTSVTIPSLYEGKSVLEVGFEAFAGARYLRSVTIPESVYRLGGGAFRGCIALESVRVPGSVSQLPAAAFLDCTALKSVELCEGIRVINANAFRNCTALESVLLPKSLQSIESCAFLGSPKLPPEIVLTGLIRRTDLSQPIGEIHDIEWESALRPDVFSLALKLGSFGENKLTEALFRIAENGPSEDFEIAARGGLLNEAELIDKLLGRASGSGNAETAAWLLEYKRRKFGFETGGIYEL